MSNRFYSYFILAMLFFFSLIIVVRAPPITWSQMYEGRFNDKVDFLIQTFDGGYVIAGNKYVSGEEMADFWMIKVDSVGNFEWNQTYSRTNEHLGIGGLVQTSEGGYAIGGKIIDTDHNQRILLIKTDEYGNMLWEKEVGVGPSDSVSALIETSDLGLALAGETIGLGNSLDFWLIKTDSDGNIEWDKQYGGTNMESASTLVELSNGGFALAGYTISNSVNYDFRLITTDSDGSIIWDQTYGNEDQEVIHALVVSSDGGYAMGGVNFTSVDFDYWLIKTDIDGNAEWRESFDGVVNGYVDHVGLVSASDGGFALAGSKGSWPEGLDTFLHKINISGNIEWTQTYSEPDFDMDLGCLISTSDGGFALAGQTEYFDIFLIKTNEQSKLVESPVASFTYIPVNPQVNGTITFDSSSCVDTDGMIVNYVWDFGDGTTSTSQNPTHIYDDEGSYTVSLTVTDNDGLTDTTTVIISDIIIPEFSSWMLMSIFLIVTSLAFLCKNKINYKKHNNSKLVSCFVGETSF
ncbi:MAG: PKD domain-containing protein [Candidatus Bathyarchaeota archaeon]